MTRILVIDDQTATLELLRALFQTEGYQVDTVGDGAEARGRLESNRYEVVFTDLRLGYPYDGLEVLELVKRIQPGAQVVIMTAFSSVESSVLAMKGGAYDYITKPFKAEEVLLLAARAAEKANLASKVALLEERLDAQSGVGPKDIIGSSPTVLQLMRLITQVARTDATVLVVGESGTGKELVARAIHDLSPRAKAPFVAVNCGAIPENLQESEFFGHQKGAFTGAIRTKTGLFEQADGGTLFLDEVGETSPATQVKLLRFLQEGELRKVGDTRSIHVDVRLVAATNQDLIAMIAAGTFREDLYYRLNIVCAEVPPLRDREGDIELLASYFLRRLARKSGTEVRLLSPEAMVALRRHHWPGNVRELENAMERAVALSRGPVIQPSDLPSFERSPPRRRSADALSRSGDGEGAGASPPRRPWEETIGRDVLLAVGAGAPEVLRPEHAPAQWRPLTGPAAPGDLPFNRELEQARFPSLEEMERQHIEAALHLFRGNRARVGVALGISRATLFRKIRQFQLEHAGRAQG